MDEDSDVDIVGSASAGAIRVLENDGTGAFPTSVLHQLMPPAPQSPTSLQDLVLVDVDLDSDLDVVGPVIPGVPGSQAHLILVSLNDGTGTFLPAAQFDPGHTVFRVAVGDVNTDGKPDILGTALMTNRMCFLANMGAGNFGFSSCYGTGAYPQAIGLFDLDGDGDRDPVCANRDSFDVSVFINSTVASGLPPYPGSNEDIALARGVNGPPTGGLGNYVKTALAGDNVATQIFSPLGAFNFLPPIIGGELSFTGSPPTGTPGFPEFQVNIFNSILLLSGLSGPFGVQLLLPSGFTVNFTPPPGLAGVSVVLQGVSANGSFATTNGYEIQFL